MKSTSFVFLLVILVFSNIAFAATEIACSVTESLGSSLKDGKYTKQKTVDFSFNPATHEKRIYESTLIEKMDLELTVSNGTIGKERATMINLDVTDGLIGTSSYDLIGVANQADNGPVTTSTWMRFYNRPNKDSLTLMCDVVR